MRRFIALTSLISLTLIAVMTIQPGANTSAQEATPVAMAEHPIVGTWRWDNDPENPGVDVTFSIFHADGSYVETSALNGTALGTWEVTGERSVRLIETFLDSDPTLAIAPGTATFLISLTVDEGGDDFSGTGSVQVRSAMGEVTFEAADLPFTGTRVVAAPLPDFGNWPASGPVTGTPVAGTPTSRPLDKDTM